MSNKDTLAKKYMRDPRKFADFFNGIMYGGEKRIDWRELQELDSSSVVTIPNLKGTKSVSIQKIRDIIKSTVVMQSDSKYYLLLGIENQSDIHYAMPVRTMLYNALTYTEQVDTITKKNRESNVLNSQTFLSGLSKADKLKPVVTVTLYWGSEHWDAPVTLKEMLAEMDEQTSALVDDCNINLFSIIDQVDMPEFSTELRELFSLLNSRGNGRKMNYVVNSDSAYENMDKDTAEMISTFASIKLPRKNKEGGYNMCKAVVEIKEEGIKEGVLDTLISLVKDGLLDINEAAKRANISVEKFKKEIEKTEQ